MNLIVLDAETYFDKDFTLSKLTTENYVRDGRFEALGWGVFECNKGKGGWLTDAEWREFYPRIDWSQTAVIAHHAHFDGFILSQIYGIKPAYWFDTLSMARLVLGPTAPASLAKLAERFGLSPKNVPYDLFRGKHWHELSPYEQQLVADGCVHDCELTFEIFKRLAPDVPRQEFDIIDMTVRMFTEPVLQGDVAMLEGLAAAEAKRKEELFTELGMVPQANGKPPRELTSDAQFAAILTGLGVEVEMKVTATGNTKPAVSKTDEFMKGLLDDENEIVSGLAEARLGVKSTIDETRSARLAGIARRGDLPVYLTYCTAQTLRWGGGDKVNFQNFRRGGDIRKAICAPDGRLLLVADLSQIECRFLEWVAGEAQAMEEFRAGVDPYCGLATDFYGFEVTKKDKLHRMFGKILRLQCGYGSGGPTIQAAAKRATPPVIISDAEAIAARDLYRRSRPGVVALWKEGDEVLGVLAGPEQTLEWRCFIVHANGDGTGWIEGPKNEPDDPKHGVRMLYELRYDEAERTWRRKTKKGWVRIWGGVVTQNLIELVSRLYLCKVLCKVRDTFPALKLCWVTHDEGVWVLPDDSDAPHYLEHVLGFMRDPPVWAPDIPLDAEGFIAKRYEK